jgi:AmiR/NasT family two-component response regulator
MRDMVVALIADKPDIEVVGETDVESQITEMVERMRPDFVIIGLDQPDVRPGLCGFLLGRYPEMKILAVSGERNQGVFYWAFVDIRSKLVETSEQGLMSILRHPLAPAEAEGTYVVNGTKRTGT